MGSAPSNGLSEGPRQLPRSRQSTPPPPPPQPEPEPGPSESESEPIPTTTAAAAIPATAELPAAEPPIGSGSTNNACGEIDDKDRERESAGAGVGDDAAAAEVFPPPPLPDLLPPRRFSVPTPPPPSVGAATPPLPPSTGATTPHLSSACRPAPRRGRPLPPLELPTSPLVMTAAATRSRPGTPSTGSRRRGCGRPALTEEEEVALAVERGFQTVPAVEAFYKQKSSGSGSVNSISVNSISVSVLPTGIGGCCSHPFSLSPTDTELAAGADPRGRYAFPRQSGSTVTLSGAPMLHCTLNGLRSVSEPSLLSPGLSPHRPSRDDDSCSYTYSSGGSSSGIIKVAGAEGGAVDKDSTTATATRRRRESAMGGAAAAAAATGGLVLGARNGEDDDDDDDDDGEHRRQLQQQRGSMARRLLRSHGTFRRRPRRFTFAGNVAAEERTRVLEAEELERSSTGAGATSAAANAHRPRGLSSLPAVVPTPFEAELQVDEEDLRRCAVADPATAQMPPALLLLQRRHTNPHTAPSCAGHRRHRSGSGGGGGWGGDGVANPLQDSEGDEAAGGDGERLRGLLAALAGQFTAEETGGDGEGNVQLLGRFHAWLGTMLVESPPHSAAGEGGRDGPPQLLPPLPHLVDSATSPLAAPTPTAAAHREDEGGVSGWSSNAAAAAILSEGSVSCSSVSVNRNSSNGPIDDDGDDENHKRDDNNSMSYNLGSVTINEPPEEAITPAAAKPSPEGGHLALLDAVPAVPPDSRGIDEPLSTPTADGGSSSREGEVLPGASDTPTTSGDGSKLSKAASARFHTRSHTHNSGTGRRATVGPSALAAATAPPLRCRRVAPLSASESAGPAAAGRAQRRRSAGMEGGTAGLHAPPPPQHDV